MAVNLTFLCKIWPTQTYFFKQKSWKYVSFLKHLVPLHKTPNLTSFKHKFLSGVQIVENFLEIKFTSSVSA